MVISFQKQRISINFGTGEPDLKLREFVLGSCPSVTLTFSHKPECTRAA